MADNINTLNNYNTESYLVPELWAKDILYANQPNFILAQFALPALEANASTVKWAVVGTLSPGGTLHSGTQIAASTLTISQITAASQEYGNAITWARDLDVMSNVDIRENVAYKTIRDDYAQCIDNKIYTEILTGTRYVGGGTFGTIAPAQFAGTVGPNDYAMNSGVLTKVVTQLNLSNAPTFDNGNYVIVMHPVQHEKLLLDGTYREVLTHATPMRLVNGPEEKIAYGWVGAYNGLDIFKSTMITTTTLNFGTSGTITAYQAVAFGKNAFGQGWDIPLEISFYDDANNDAKRTKKLIWYAHGLIKLLKPENTRIVRTT